MRRSIGRESIAELQHLINSQDIEELRLAMKELQSTAGEHRKREEARQKEDHDRRLREACLDFLVLLLVTLNGVVVYALSELTERDKLRQFASSKNSDIAIVHKPKKSANPKISDMDWEIRHTRGDTAAGRCDDAWLPKDEGALRENQEHYS